MHATHVYNRTPMHHLKWDTPYTLLNGEAPDISHLKVFGCGAYVHISKETHANGLAPKSELIAYLLPPEQVAELLPWYMQWSWDLAAEMHLRCLVRNDARRTHTLPISSAPCDCASDWRCEPHGACFIHDSCFCPGSGSFPPVKPPHS